MEIKKENMLYRLFMWCLGLCESFTNKSLRSKYKYQTNLCHFVRVICLYTPIIIISNLMFYGMASAVFILPFFFFSLKSIGIVFLFLLGACLLVFMIFGVVYLFAEDVIADWFRENETMQVAAEYIRAKKERICPYIYFKRG